MKVSQEKKREIKSNLIDAAVEIITEKGFRSATMREISEKAGFGTATIYNYFPNKEKILYGYFEEKHNKCNDVLNEIADFNEYSFKEKLQIQLESLFDLYLQDREFVQEAYKLIFDSPLRTFTEFTPIKKLFINKVQEFYKSAIEKNEIPEHPFEDFIINLYWDYSGIILLYWLKDNSTGFTNTSQIIDMSLDIVVNILKTGIITKVADIASFLFRSHIYSNIENIHNLFSSTDKIHKYFNNMMSKDFSSEDKTDG